MANLRLFAAWRKSSSCESIFSVFHTSQSRQLYFSQLDRQNDLSFSGDVSCTCRNGQRVCLHNFPVCILTVTSLLHTWIHNLIHAPTTPEWLAELHRWLRNWQRHWKTLSRYHSCARPQFYCRPGFSWNLCGDCDWYPPPARHHGRSHFIIPILQRKEWVVTQVLNVALSISINISPRDEPRRETAYARASWDGCVKFILINLLSC